MKQSAKLGGWDALSHALWAAARKVEGICQTEAAVMRPAPGPGGMVAAGFWAIPNVETRRAAANNTGFISGILCRNSVMQAEVSFEFQVSSKGNRGLRGERGSNEERKAREDCGERRISTQTHSITVRAPLEEAWGV